MPKARLSLGGTVVRVVLFLCREEEEEVEQGARMQQLIVVFAYQNFFKCLNRNLDSPGCSLVV